MNIVEIFNGMLETVVGAFEKASDSLKELDGFNTLKCSHCGYPVLVHESIKNFHCSVCSATSFVDEIINADETDGFTEIPCPVCGTNTTVDVGVDSETFCEACETKINILCIDESNLGSLLPENVGGCSCCDECSEICGCEDDLPFPEEEQCMGCGNHVDDCACDLCSVCGDYVTECSCDAPDEPFTGWTTEMEDDFDETSPCVGCTESCCFAVPVDGTDEPAKKVWSMNAWSING